MSEFRKLTVPLPPKLWGRVLRESVRRKVKGEPDHLPGGVVRDAVKFYFDHTCVFSRENASVRKAQ